MNLPSAHLGMAVSPETETRLDAGGARNLMIGESVLVRLLLKLMQRWKMKAGFKVASELGDAL